MSPKQTLRQLPRPLPAPSQSLAFSLLRTHGGGWGGLATEWDRSETHGSQAQTPAQGAGGARSRQWALGALLPSLRPHPAALKAGAHPDRLHPPCLSPPYHRPSPSPALGTVTAAEADTLTTPRSWGPLTQAGQLFQGPQGAPQLLRPHPAQWMGPVFRAQQTVSNSSQGVVTPCVRPLLGQGCVLDKRVVTLGLQNPGQGGWGWGGSRRNF